MFITNLPYNLENVCSDLGNQFINKRRYSWELKIEVKTREWNERFCNNCHFEIMYGYFAALENTVLQASSTFVI